MMSASGFPLVGIVSGAFGEVATSVCIGNIIKFAASVRIGTLLCEIANV
jgi:hypothetical protein